MTTHKTKSAELGQHRSFQKQNRDASEMGLARFRASDAKRIDNVNIKKSNIVDIRSSQEEKRE